MCLHYCLTKQWSYRKKRSTQQLIGQLMRLLPGCWEVIGQNPEGNLQVLGRGEGVFQFSSHIKAIKHCVCMGGALGPTSYQENGAKETEAGDRKLGEEAAPIVPAQHCFYGNRQQGGKSVETARVESL